MSSLFVVVGIQIFLCTTPPELFTMRMRENPEPSAKMAAVLKARVDRNHGYGGGIVRLERANGDLIWENATGLLGQKGSSPIALNDQFEIASITKLFTAVVVLQLIEEGMFSLDTPVAKLFKQGSLPPSFERHPERFLLNVSIEDLLRHTSGFDDVWREPRRGENPNTFFLTEFLANSNRFWDARDVLQFATRSDTRAKKKNHLYSDVNFILLGLLLEEQARQPLHVLFSQRIFRPLGMRNTFLSYRETKRGEGRLSHRFEGSLDLHEARHQSADWAGGGLVSSTRDLLLFLRALSQGSLFQKPETLKTMQNATSTSERDIAYGLGMYKISLSPRQGALFGHDGHGNSFLFYWPDRDVFAAGTLNQLENDWYPMFLDLVALLNL